MDYHEQHEKAAQEQEELHAIWKAKADKETSRTYIHINQHKIRSNKKNNENEPVITIKEGKKNTYCHSVKINGSSTLVYGGNDKPLLSCGARVVLELDPESTYEIVT